MHARFKEVRINACLVSKYVCVTEVTVSTQSFQAVLSLSGVPRVFDSDVWARLPSKTHRCTIGARYQHRCPKTAPPSFEEHLVQLDIKDVHWARAESRHGMNEESK